MGDELGQDARLGLGSDPIDQLALVRLVRRPRHADLGHQLVPLRPDHDDALEEPFGVLAFTGRQVVLELSEQIGLLDDVERRLDAQQVARLSEERLRIEGACEIFLSSPGDGRRYTAVVSDVGHAEHGL